MLAPCLNIVVVEDHDLLRGAMVEVLREQGHSVVGLACAEAMDDEVGADPVDLLIVDLNLPGEDGINLARRFRAAQPRSGIVMVTARSQVLDKIHGYKSGADIYLTKPVAPEELLAAVAALGRRLEPHDGPLNAGTGATLLLDRRKLSLRGPQADVSLSAAEAAILSALARAPGQRLDAWQLLELLGVDNDCANSKANLEVRMVRLRCKLKQSGAAPPHLRAIRLQGYQLCVALQVL